LQELFDVASEKAEETKRRDRERKKQRYAEDSEYREKIKARNRARHLKNKDARNARRRQRRKPNREFTLKRHGMSLAEYAARLADQGGVCVICLKAREKVLCVDHDHRTKKLRSLLCDSCNLGLGHYNDDAAAMRRAADYLEYWQWRHADPCNTGPPPFAACNQQGSFAPSLPAIQSPPLTGEDMTPADETTEEGKASRMMRRAILHELLQPFDPDPLPPVHMLQAVSRAIVVKAAQGDMTAAREILDRIDGKTATAPAAPETPNEVVFTWQRRWSSITRRAKSSSRSTNGASASLLIGDAILWREAKAKAKATVAKPLPPVQRPGVSQPKGAAQEAVIQNPTEKLDASGSLKDAAALLKAHRAVR
jgi:Recombination endonuclease VII